MTRINVVPVQCLSDKHLLAEYKEITQPFNKVFKRLEEGTFEDVKIPEKYCLGTGHETFFFDKLTFLFRRYLALKEELVDRGVNVDLTKFESIRRDLLKNTAKAMNSGKYRHVDYTPTPEDMYLNMARLTKRCKFTATLEELNSER